MPVLERPAGPAQQMIHFMTHRGETWLEETALLELMQNCASFYGEQELLWPWVTTALTKPVILENLPFDSRKIMTVKYRMSEY